MGSSCARGVQSVGDAVSAGGAVSTGLVPLVFANDAGFWF